MNKFLQHIFLYLISSDYRMEVLLTKLRKKYIKNYIENYLRQNTSPNWDNDNIFARSEDEKTDN